MKKGFLIKQKGTIRKNVQTALHTPPPSFTSTQSLSFSSSWKRGFLNPDEKKSQPHRASKKKKEKCRPQGTIKNDSYVAIAGAKKKVADRVESCNGARQGLPSQLKKGKDEPTKNKTQTSSALLFMEEAEPASRSSILSIVNYKDDGDTTGINPTDGSYLANNPKGIALPLYERDDYEKREEILLQEVETKVRGGNVVGHDVEGAINTAGSSTPFILNVDYKRQPPVFQLQEEKQVLSEVAQSADIQGFRCVPSRGQAPSELGDQIIEGAISQNRDKEIDRPRSMECHGIEKQDGHNLGKSEVTTSIKMELSLLLSKLKTQSKKNQVSSKRGEFTKKDDIKLASNNALLRFIQKHLQSEGSPASVLNNLNLVWKTILESIALYAKDNFTLPNSRLEQAEDLITLLPPVIWLGLSILQNCPKEGWITLFDIVSNNSNMVGSTWSSDEKIHKKVENVTGDKRKKLQTLGAALLIKLQLYLSINRLSNTTVGDGKSGIDNACIEISGIELFIVAVPCMLQKFLPFFIGIIDKKAVERKRSLLSTACMDAALLIIEYTAHAYRCALCEIKSPIIDTIPSILWTAFPLMKQILDVTQKWVTNEESMPNCGCYISEERSGEGVVKYIDASRKHCAAAMIHDWSRVISDTEEIYYQCKFIGMQVEQMSQKTAVLSLCNELAGVKISRGQSEKCLLIGGIAHTLCKCVPEYRITSVEILLEALGAASYFVEKGAESDSPSDVYYNEETIILRAVCSWFARKKYFQWTKFGNISCPDVDNKVQDKHQKAVQLCMTSLRSRSGRCSDFVIVLLSRLWSDSNGLPADMYEVTQSQVRNADLPISFENLLQNFDAYECEEEHVLKPPQKVMCSLVERFISHKPEILLPFFLSRRQVNIMSVHVLVSILEKSAINEANHSSMLSGDISLLVVEKVLDLVGSNKYLQKKLLEYPDILSSFAPSITVPRLVEIIGRDVSSNYITVVTTMIGGILKCCPEYHLENAIFCIIKGVESLDEKGKSQSNYQFPLVKYASIWRRSILQDQSLGQTRYTKLLTTIANFMFRMPSSSYPLSLFGAFIGDGTNICDKSHRKEEKITMRNTVKAVLKLALPNINEEIEDPEKQLFSRLSPLLMLRRIPSTYVRLLEIHDDSDYALLIQLAKTVTMKLGIEEHKTHHEVKTPEEKRLLAEIAARYLPFSGKLSCFERFCRPVFSRTLHSIDQGTVTRIVLDQAKFSLYLVCHFVQIAADRDYADGLVTVTTFALQIVSLVNVCDGDICSDQIIQLQTGCIDFFATCLQSHCNRIVNNGKEQPSRPRMIQEIDPMSTQSVKGSSSSQQSVSEKIMANFLGSLLPLLLEIISTAQIPEISVNTQWLDLKALNSSSKKCDQFCFSARTCLLNSFSLAAQRCSIDNGSLELLAHLASPSILQFASGTTTDNRLKHKLCIAASLQYTFNVLTRTKSFQCLKMQSFPIAECVRQMFMLCANIIKTHSGNSDAYVSGLLRTTSLKLLLAITSVDQCGNGRDDNTFINVQDCLVPGELAQVFSILHGAANIDTDSGVNALAIHILATLQKKNL